MFISYFSNNKMFELMSLFIVLLTETNIYKKKLFSSD